jgi:hypothetical protein
MLEVVCCSAVVTSNELNGNPGRRKLPPPLVVEVHQSHVAVHRRFNDLLL